MNTDPAPVPHGWHRIVDGITVWERRFHNKVGHVVPRPDGMHVALFDGCLVGLAVDLTIAQQMVEATAT